MLHVVILEDVNGFIFSGTRVRNTEKLFVGFHQGPILSSIHLSIHASHRKESFKAQKFMLNLHPSFFHMLYVHPQSKPIPSMRRVCLPTIWLIFTVHLVGKIYEFP